MGDALDDYHDLFDSADYYSDERKRQMGDMADYDADRLCDLDSHEWERGGEPVPIDFVRIAHQTVDAWLLVLKEGRFTSTTEWFPKSRCTLDEDECIVTVPEWLALEKDLI